MMKFSTNIKSFFYKKERKLIFYNIWENSSNDLKKISQRAWLLSSFSVIGLMLPKYSPWALFVKSISRNFREIHFTKKLHRLLFGSKYFSWEIDDWRGFFCFAILSKLMRWERNDKCAILISLWKSVFIKQSPRISPPLCGLPVNAPFFMPPSLSQPLFSYNELKWGKNSTP